MARFSLKHLLLGVAIVAIGLAAMISLKRWADPFDDLAFKPAGWAKAAVDGRAGMSRDLIRNHIRKGMSQGEVEALIGNQFTIYINPSAHDYYIGSWSVEGMDDAFVCVYYDANGKVSHAEIDDY